MISEKDAKGIIGNTYIDESLDIESNKLEVMDVAKEKDRWMAIIEYDDGAEWKDLAESLINETYFTLLE